MYHLQMGDGELMMDGHTTLKLAEIRHVPRIRRSLISVGQPTDLGYKVTFERGGWRISRGAMVIVRGKRK